MSLENFNLRSLSLEENNEKNCSPLLKTQFIIKDKLEVRGEKMSKSPKPHFRFIPQKSAFLMFLAM